MFKSNNQAEHALRTRILHVRCSAFKKSDNMVKDYFTSDTVQCVYRMWQKFCIDYLRERLERAR